jgi:hypothetical protein
MYVRSFDEGQEECRSGEQLVHDFSIIVQHLIDLPLKYESLSVLSIARKDRGFLATELVIINSVSSSVIVGIVGVVGISPSVPAASSVSTTSAASFWLSSSLVEAPKGVSATGRVSARWAGSFDSMAVVSLAHRCDGAGLCLSSHDSGIGGMGLRFISRYVRDRVC